jgi:hypothetical protein
VGFDVQKERQSFHDRFRALDQLLIADEVITRLMGMLYSDLKGAGQITEQPAARSEGTEYLPVEPLAGSIDGQRITQHVDDFCLGKVSPQAIEVELIGGGLFDPVAEAGIYRPLAQGRDVGQDNGDEGPEQQIGVGAGL